MENSVSMLKAAAPLQCILAKDNCLCVAVEHFGAKNEKKTACRTNYFNMIFVFVYPCNLIFIIMLVVAVAHATGCMVHAQIPC